MKKRKFAKPVTPSAADLFRKAMASEDEDEREIRTLAAIANVLRVASHGTGDGPLVVVGAGIDSDNVIDDRPCVHCGAPTDNISIFHPPPGVIPVPPKTTVAVIATLCDDCNILYKQSDEVCAAVGDKVLAIINE